MAPGIFPLFPRAFAYESGSEERTSSSGAVIRGQTIACNYANRSFSRGLVFGEGKKSPSGGRRTKSQLISYTKSERKL